MVDVTVSRHTPTLKPGDGELIKFYEGEHVTVCEKTNIDFGREFVVCSDRKWHASAPGTGYVREGFFVDDPTRTFWAKSESMLWPADLNYRP